MSMSGGGSKSKQRAWNEPDWPSDVTGLRQELIQPMTENAWSESQFYPALANMYQGVMSQAQPGISPQVSESLNKAVSSGLPMTTEAFMSAAQPYAQGAYPAYQSALDMALGQAKETSGMSGNLRGTAGYEALGRGASSTTADFMKYLTNMASQSYEAAAGRQMAAIPLGLQAELIPGQEAAGLSSAITAADLTRYPMLAPAMAMATTGMGQAGASKGESASQQGGGGISCCFIFIEGERLTNNVRDLRDKMFPKGGVVETGYRRAARWLVPRMARNWFVKEAVRLVMLDPICSVADHYYGYNSYGWVFRPVGHFWKKVFERLGR